MSYKISLVNPSQLKFVCGLAIPNGYYHVMEMDFDNARQFENLKKAKGHAEVKIEKVDLKPGAYREDGQRVDYVSLKDWCWGNTDTIQLEKEKPEVSTPSVEPSVVDELKAKLDEKGIKYRSNATQKALEGLLAAS